MAAPDRSRRRILGRLSVRARIALASAGLFLLTGAAFVAALYALVDHSLGPSVSQVPAALTHICQTLKSTHTADVHRALYAECPFGPNDRRRYLHLLLVWSTFALGAATIVAGILGWAIGRRILAPLHKVTAVARRATEERLAERIGLDGPDDELKELADTFDEMLNRLDLAFASQRRFVANASHELRTPLTSMRTLIDVAMAKPTRTAEQLESVVGRVRESIDQSEALIDGLLTLARSDRGLTTHELVDLEAAAQDALDQADVAVRSAGIVVEADLSPGPTLGDRVLVERLVANLVDNAVRYNVRGGSVQVETGTDEGQSYVSVANTGPVVPESKLASLFEPFTRLDQRVAGGQGVGLGLSIVASVVAAHRADLRADALPAGGLKLTVRFPEAGPWPPPDRTRASSRVLSDVR